MTPLPAISVVVISYVTQSSISVLDGICRLNQILTILPLNERLCVSEKDIWNTMTMNLFKIGVVKKF